MKLLFSRYNFLLNVLSDLAFELGFKGNVSLQMCLYLNLRGRPIHPTRNVISTKEMKKLVTLADSCYNDIFHFVGVLGL